MTRRFTTPGVLSLLLFPAACGGRLAPSGVPLSSEPFTQWLVSNATGRTAPSTCPRTRIDLGPTSMTPLRNRRLQLPLPASYVHVAHGWPEERVRYPVIGWELGNEWRPGLHILPSWDRWSHLQTLGTPSESLFQVVEWSGYQPFAADPPWTLAGASECILRLSARWVRVLRFELHHPSQPSEWGLVAYWHGGLGNGELSALMLGPDRAIQEEALEILRRQVP